MKKFHRCTRIFILSLLFISVCVPICFLSHKIKSVHSDEPGEFVEDLSIIKHRTEAHIASALEEEESEDVKEPLMVVYKDDKFSSDSLIESNRTDESENTENATLGESGLFYSDIIIYLYLFLLIFIGRSVVNLFQESCKLSKKRINIVSMRKLYEIQRKMHSLSLKGFNMIRVESHIPRRHQM
nr:probable galacturonosyltransferase 6 [Ipomoea batatas]